jgi:CHASE2 domain-containing sensor protein
VALDFMLTTDSLSKDELLATELSRVRNLVRATILHKYDKSANRWDSLETFHAKFGQGKVGFSNITISDDSVFVPELPMRQFALGKTITSLSYSIADNSFGVKPQYKTDPGKFFYFSINKSFKIISANNLLSEKFDANDLNGKIVILGHAGPGEDNFYLNRQRTRTISGVEIHANIVGQIINVE